MMTVLAVSAAVVFLGVVTGLTAAAAENAQPATIHVKVDGSDDAAGSAEAPLKTIDAALNKAGPGDTILVHAGTYSGMVAIAKSGAPDKPIRLVGEGKVVITGGRDGITVRDSDWVEIENFTIEGVSRGILFHNVRHVSARKCVVRQCVSGVIWQDKYIHDAVIEDIDIDAPKGGGFGISRSAVNDLKNCRVVRVFVHDGGGMKGIDAIGMSHAAAETKQTMELVGCKVWNFNGDCYDFGKDNCDLKVVDCVAYANGNNAAFKIWGDRVQLINCVSYRNGLAFAVSGKNVEMRHCLSAFDKVGLELGNNTREGAGDGMKVIGCIFHKASRAGMYLKGKGQTASYEVLNCLFSACEPVGCIRLGAECLKADAAFVAPEENDSRLTANSPAVDAASPVGAPPADLLGNKRADGKPDIGPYEYVGAKQ